MRTHGEPARADEPAHVAAVVPAGLSEQLRVVLGQPLWVLGSDEDAVEVHVAASIVAREPPYARPANLAIAGETGRRRQTGSYTPLPVNHEMTRSGAYRGPDLRQPQREGPGRAGRARRADRLAGRTRANRSRRPPARTPRTGHRMAARDPHVDGVVPCRRRAALEERPPFRVVLKEATVLAWRRSLDKDFVLIPILLPPIKRSDLEKGSFRPLVLNEIQFGSPGALAEVATRLERVRQADIRLPTDAWIKRLALDLSQIEQLGATMGRRSSRTPPSRRTSTSTGSRASRVASDCPSPGVARNRRRGACRREPRRRRPDREALDDLIEALVPVWVDPLAAARSRTSPIRKRGSGPWPSSPRTRGSARCTSCGPAAASHVAHLPSEQHGGGRGRTGRRRHRRAARGWRADAAAGPADVDRSVHRGRRCVREAGRPAVRGHPQPSHPPPDQIAAIHHRLKVFTLVLLGSPGTKANPVGPAMPQDKLLDLGEARERRGVTTATTSGASGRSPRNKGRMNIVAYRRLFDPDAPEVPLDLGRATRESGAVLATARPSPSTCTPTTSSLPSMWPSKPTGPCSSAASPDPASPRSPATWRRSWAGGTWRRSSRRARRRATCNGRSTRFGG